MQRIGFIGASGLTGHGMAKNRIARGHLLTLTVHRNRNRERVADLRAAGASDATFAVGQRAGVNPHKLVELVSAGAVNSGLFQATAKALNGDLGRLKFELDNARKDIRYHTHLAASLNVPAVVGEAVHQSLVLASALGYGSKFVPSLIEAQEQLTGAKLVPR